MSRIAARPVIKLRTVNSGEHEPASPKSPRTIAISSGKGGVGKSTVTLNLAIQLSRLGHRVCIFDADTNLANINILTGLSPRYTLSDVLAGRQTMADILLDGPQDVRIVPAASGMLNMLDLDATQCRIFLQGLSQLEQQFDFILIDTAAGISESVLSFLQAAGEVMLVITAEPTSLTDAFSLLKVLQQQGFNKPFQVLVNRVSSYDQAKQVLGRFSSAVRKYLKLKIVQPGYVLDDERISRAAMAQQAVTLAYPQAQASRCLEHFARRIGEHEINGTEQGGDHSLAAYLEQQYRRMQSQPVFADAKSNESVSAMKTDELESFLHQLHSAPFEKAEQMVARVNQAWLARLDQQALPQSWVDTAQYRSAIRFASKLNQSRKPE